MKHNFVDIIVLVYVLLGTFKGWRGGFSREFPRLVGVTVVFVTGCGMYRWTEHALAKLSVLTGHTVGVVSWVTLIAVTFFVVRQFRGRMREWAAQKFPEPRTQKRAGAITGLARTCFVSAIVLLFVDNTPLRSFARNSFTGRNLITIVLPVYRAVDRPK